MSLASTWQTQTMCLAQELADGKGWPALTRSARAICSAASETGRGAPQFKGMLAVLVKIDIRQLKDTHLPLTKETLNDYFANTSHPQGFQDHGYLALVTEELTADCIESIATLIKQKSSKRSHSERKDDIVQFNNVMSLDKVCLGVATLSTEVATVRSEFADLSNTLALAEDFKDVQDTLKTRYMERGMSPRRDRRSRTPRESPKKDDGHERKQEEAAAANPFGGGGGQDGKNFRLTLSAEEADDDQALQAAWFVQHPSELIKGAIIAGDVRGVEACLCEQMSTACLHQCFELNQEHTRSTKIETLMIAKLRAMKRAQNSAASSSVA